MTDLDASEWRHRLTDGLASASIWIAERVEVVEEVPSTQDLAFDRCAGRPGLLLWALSQTAGRGRLGRTWVTPPGKGVAMTLVVDAARFKPERLSLACGVAAVESGSGSERGLGNHGERGSEAPRSPLGLRWPNDIVERGAMGRKVGGILVEVRSGLALLGVGMNVLHARSDFPEALRGRATSLRELGLRADLAAWTVQFLKDLQAALLAGPAALARAWERLDVLVGTHQTFVHDRRTVGGVVLSIDPEHEIVVQTGPSTRERLPAATTSLVHSSSLSPPHPAE
ncbi:MAG: biotin--[acetyl-CoA-carboxylase] ligase [Phycisphaerales bacterium]|nr:biotin--[acetyl-CoA-carboxylase] ligase [Phycisphaerales bacterium]